MRKQTEIAKRFEEKKKQFWCFESEVLLPYLDFEHAKPFLKEEATQDDWDAACRSYTREVVLDEAKTYMREYGWPKAQNHRSISASRTIDKMTAWVWLVDDEDLLESMEETAYENYGAPILEIICDHYDWPILDDSDLQNMMLSDPCEPSCAMGCGT